MSAVAPVPTTMPNTGASEQTNFTDAEQASLQAKLRIGETEDVLLTRRCSVFAFMWLYFIGIMIFVVHYLFDTLSAPADAEWYQKIIYFLIEASAWSNGLGFAFVMFFLTWFNRIFNHPASGRWVTMYLLMISFTPLLINLDELLRVLTITDENFMPFGYDLTIAGIIWSSLFILITFWYQKSFLYAVTTERIIHYQSFIYERDGHRILHEDILAVHKNRSPLGALFGYATIYCNIGDSSHISTETIGGAVAIPGSSASNDPDSKSGGGIFGLLRKAIWIFKYQRTIKTERFTPEVSWYGIRKWEEAFDLINRLHHENSTATKAEQQIAVQKQMVELLSKAQEDNSTDLPGMSDLL